MGNPSICSKRFALLPHLCLLLALLIPALSQAQQNSTQQAGYYTFGLNAGLSYQSSDIKALPEGFGLGATLAKNLYYRPGAALSFDLRGRLLYAQQLGLDNTRSFDILNNSVLNGSQNLDYINYPQNLGESQGFVFQNHKTDVFELGLEGVLTLNKLRERTGVIASIYGGLGLDWFRTKIDQADASGNPYYSQYSALDQQKSAASIRTELKEAILDGEYESLADGFDSEGGTIGLMPSLGIELGYEVTPIFSVHLGHRTTFSGNDILDGQQWANPNNDLYHYTHFALRWKVRPQESRLVAPVIDIISPNTFPFTSPVINGLVRARVRHVQNAADIRCTINGREQSFTFSRGSFSKPFRLENGANEVIITATNSVGSTEKRLVIYYEKPETPTPVVKIPDVLFTQPRSNTAESSDPNYQVQASITEIQSKDQINFTVNGQKQNFQFNVSTGRLQSNISLREGSNQVRIEATNRAGRDSESVTIRFDRGTRPIVDITNPNTSPISTDRNSFFLEARIDHLKQRTGITLLLNGRNVNTYSFDLNTGRLSANLNLQEGDNRVRLSAENERGQAQDEVNIRYEAPRPIQLPEVRITSPNADYRTSTRSVRLRARTQFVERRTDINLQLNNRTINDFRFSNGIITADLPLQLGFNQVRISVRNLDGQDEDAISIERFEDIIVAQPPRVNIEQPNQNQVSNQANIQVVASVLNVRRKAEVQVVINGRNTNNFDYNAARRQVLVNVSLIPGNNNIQIMASTNSGSDRDQVNITYQPSLPPIVSITQPSNGSTLTNRRTNFRATIQNVSQRNQIRLLLNGRPINDFNFNVNRREITAALNLQEGNNAIEVQVANNGGQAQDQVNVRYQGTSPPSVSIDQPSNNSSATSSSVSFAASTTQISNRSEIRLFLNGQAITNFDFNLLRGTVSTNLNLQNGTNNIRIQVQNEDGADQDEVQVIYQPATPPSVTISVPQNNSTSPSQRLTLKVRTENIQSRNDITLSLNGNPINNFGFQSARQEITAQLTLQPGSNTIRAAVRNQDGQDADQVVVNYQPPKPPQITINSPQSGLSLSEPQVQLTATTQAVDNRNEISLLVNGTPVSTFEWDGTQLTATIKPLKSGQNTITAKVSNGNGSDQAELSITYTPVVRTRAPSVSFITPSEEEITHNENVYTAKVKVLNVTAKEQIRVNVNRGTTPDFDFDPISGMVSIHLDLKNPRNVVAVFVTTTGGSANARAFINYVPKQPDGDKPFVRIESVSQPTINPLNPTAARSTITATIKNVTAEQISLKVNDRVITNFSYNPTSGMFQCTYNLDKGENRIVLRASSEAGSDEGVRIITF